MAIPTSIKLVSKQKSNLPLHKPTCLPFACFQSSTHFTFIAIPSDVQPCVYMATNFLLPQRIKSFIVDVVIAWSLHFIVCLIFISIFDAMLSAHTFHQSFYMCRHSIMRQTTIWKHGKYRHIHNHAVACFCANKSKFLHMLTLSLTLLRVWVWVCLALCFAWNRT